MVGVDHCDFNVVELLRTALVHLRCLLDAFLLQPRTKLRNADHLRIMLLHDCHCIADVVSVPMRAEHDVDSFNFLFVLGTCRISHDPRVNQHDFALWSLNTESCVSEPGNLDSIQFHSQTSLAARPKHSSGGPDWLQCSWFSCGKMFPHGKTETADLARADCQAD